MIDHFTDKQEFILPSQRQVQEYLVSKGHDIEVDGVIGKESREAWELESNKEAK
jgi:hypothetical protein